MSHRRFAITIYNKDLKTVEYDKTKIKYAILGLETCPTTKRVHIQGYIETFKKVRPTAIKKYFNDNTIHIKPAIADREHNRNYCKKEGQYIEHNYIESVTETIIRMVNLNYTDMMILKEYPEIYEKHYDLYQRIKKTITDEKNKLEFDLYWKDFKLNELQENIYKLIKNNNDVRKILWFYDIIGNRGKSTLCNYILANMENVIILNNAKNADIAYIYNNEELMLFDFPRTLEDKVNYTVLENFKNCRILNTKYKVIIKYFKCPKIVVFANFKPDITKLSKDRWNIYKILKGSNMPMLDW